MKAQPIPKTTLRQLRKRFEKRRKSKWRGDNVSRVVPKVLPFQFGDGRQFIALSFYAAPEIEVIVPFDHDLPMDLPDERRLKEIPLRRCCGRPRDRNGQECRSFRDVLDEVYELCQNLIRMPKWRERELAKEGKRDELTPWEVAIDHGSTWCRA